MYEGKLDQYLQQLAWAEHYVRQMQERIVNDALNRGAKVEIFHDEIIIFEPEKPND